jgi:hypothetical protein
MTKNPQQLPLPSALLHPSNPNLDQSRTKIVWTRRMENWLIYAPFEYMKLRKRMIGRLLRCFFIIIRHRRHRSCLHPAIAFIYALLLCIYVSFSHYPAHDIPLRISVFSLFSTFPASFKLKLSFSFLPFGSARLTFLSIDIRHHLHSIQRL